MRFQVSPKIKGSLVLKTLGRPLNPNSFVVIEGEHLAAGDIKAAVEQEILIPEDREEFNVLVQDNSKITLVNTGNMVVIIEGRPLRPKCKAKVSPYILDDDNVKNMLSRGIVKVFTDKKETVIVEKTEEVEEVEEVVEVEEIEEIEEENLAEKTRKRDTKTTPVVFNMRTQEIKEAEVISKPSTILDISDDDVIEEKTPRKKTNKRSKKKSKKKSQKKISKKKGMKLKSKKNRRIEPVGEIKAEKTEMDAAMELDSRGKPLSDKPSEVIQHMIKDLSAPTDMSFVDKEQAQKRKENRDLSG